MSAKIIHLFVSSALEMYEFSCVYFQKSPRTTASRIAPQAAKSRGVVELVAHATRTGPLRHLAQFRIR